MNSPHPADPQIAALHRAQAAHPRFAATSCSQCGNDTGPGDSGFSHCADHRARDAERAVFRAAAQAIDASQRPCFDPDYGSYTGSPLDPRTTEDDDTDPVCASDAAMEVAGRADRAFQAGNRAAAADLYRTAAQMLVVAAEVAEAL